MYVLFSLLVVILVLRIVFSFVGWFLVFVCRCLVFWIVVAALCWLGIVLDLFVVYGVCIVVCIAAWCL